MYSTSKYGHLVIEGRRITPPTEALRLSVEQIRKRIDPTGEIAARGQRILDMINYFKVAGEFHLPRIVIKPEKLTEFESCEKPQDIISLAEIESLIEAFRSGNHAYIDHSLSTHGMELVTTFPLPNEKSGRLMLLSGPSGVGKGTIQERYLVPNGVPKWVFFNIRDRRTGELNGVMYYFVESDKGITSRCRTLIEMYTNGAFVSSAVVHQPEIESIPDKRSQGVGKNLFELISKEGEDWFAEVDLKLAAQLIMRGRREGLKVNYVFLLPSSFEDLMNRIIKRTLEKKETVSEKDLEEMRNRMINAQGEIAFSFLLHPRYVINRENQEQGAGQEVKVALGFVSRESAAVAAQKMGKISGRVTVMEYERAIQMAQSEDPPLRLLPANYPMILKVPGEVSQALRSQIERLVKEEGKVNVPSVLSVMRAKIRPMVWEADVNPLKLVVQLHPGLEQKYTLAIQPGTLAPYHNGHRSAAQAAILDGGLAGAVVLSGGDPPEKKFVVAAPHREAMVRLGLIDRPYLHYSAVRVQIQEILKGVEMGGKDEEENRRLRDLAAFSFIVSVNPHIGWEYITGVDKVNNYGLAGEKGDGTGKNERELVMDLLVGNNVPIRYYLGGRGKLTLFEQEEAYCRRNKRTSWVLQHKDQIKQYLLEGAIPSFPITATRVRKMVEEHISLLDVIPEPIIGYIFDNGLRSAYILENQAKWLKAELSGDRISDDNAKRMLATINEGRRALADLGILADGSPLTLDDIRKLT